jgi:OOP family OmpA-OmpF porin
MQTSSLIRGTVALLAAGFVSTSALASADEGFELGGFAGIHIYNDDNELSVADRPDADSLGNSLAIGMRLAYGITHMFSVEGEFALMPTSMRDGDADVMNFGLRAQGLAHFMEGKLRPFALLGAGVSIGAVSDAPRVRDDTDFVIHAGGGVKYAIGDSWGVRGDVRILLPPSSANESLTTDFEILIGGYKTFGTAEVAKLVTIITPKDTDGDGLMDDEDKCPNDPEDIDQHEDADGCPDTDNDGDGIADADDKCPDVPESANGIDDEDGCPEDDPDGDGIYGSNDACPNDAEDMDGFEDTDGCPDNDNDGDGIADADDKCIDVPETANGYEDEDGCPDDVPEVVKQFTGTIKGIAFGNASAKITRASNKTLDKAAAVLEEFPSLKIEIGGHTDNVGKRDFNVRLSQMRADAVRDYFIGKGIAEDRLTAVGYGPDEPLADNDSRAGRAENRRVEFKLISGSATKEE